MKTPLKSELILLPQSYKGMLCSVTDDPIVENNGLYIANGGDVLNYYIGKRLDSRGKW